jgi:cobalt/nickel transport system permease protein
MHIPDGYLSPATCATLYAAAAPFWYLATQRLKRLLHTRLIPLISLFAAFSFVIMMFNLPLPGGTTGHAVGVGIATIVLGPWGAMLAISVTLLIQSLFFGDGGVTAIGANCFNIAIAGSLVAYGVYRIVAGRSSLVSPRRVVAAGLAGYFAINAAALLTAIEFGIQPSLYKDASGVPLYAPYPLGIAIPAMMVGHLTIAGLAELIVTAGVTSWLQRSDPSILKMTAPNAIDLNEAKLKVAVKNGWRPTRPLWIGLAALMIITPLGLLATGAAWGEWSPQDFTDPQAREQITAASGNQQPPTQAPQGLERLSSIWTAPIPDYAPKFMRSQSFGYILSAIFGVGVIILTGLSIGRIVRRGRNSDAEERLRNKRK